MNPGAQTTELVLQKSHPGESWGFRLTGGIDFTTALSVSQVNPGGLAERCGLRAGDAVLRINDIPSDELEHEQAKYEILRAGDQVRILVQRAAVTIWKPQVTSIKDLQPHERQQYQGDDGDELVQKTSLAYKQPEPMRIGSGYNRSARPFPGRGGPSSAPPPAAPPANFPPQASQPFGNAGGYGAEPQPAATGGYGTQPGLVNNQYNSPIQAYSGDNVANSYQSQAQALSSDLSSLTVSDETDGKTLQNNNKSQFKPSPTLLAVLNDGKNSQKSNKLPKDTAFNKDIREGEEIKYEGYSNPNKQSRSFRMLESNLVESDIQSTIAAGGIPASGPIRSVRAPTAKPPGERKPQAQHMTCGVCGMLVTGVFVKVAGEPMHADCYKCTRCGMSLKQKGYIIVDDKLCCDTCATQTATPPGDNMSAVPVYR